MMLFPNAGTGPAGVFLLVTSVGPVPRREHGGTSAPHFAEGAAGSVGPNSWPDRWVGLDWVRAIRLVPTVRVVPKSVPTHDFGKPDEAVRPVFYGLK
jgi:hypothetical protein